MNMVWHYYKHVTRQVITKMLLPGGGEPASKYPQVIVWFPVEAAKAEQIDDYFGKKQREVYLHYRLKVMGALIDASQPTTRLFAYFRCNLTMADQRLLCDKA